MTSRDLILRVKSNQTVLKEIFEKKKAKQDAYYESNNIFIFYFISFKQCLALKENNAH